jgi:hypothetical protein
MIGEWLFQDEVELAATGVGFDGGVPGAGDVGGEDGGGE